MYRISAVFLMTVLGLWPAVGWTDAESGTLAQHLLEILRAEGIVDEAKYRELSQIAEAERQALADVAAKGGDPPVTVAWKDGFWLEAPQHGFKLGIGGRLHNDWAIFAEDNAVETMFGEIGSGTKFRRARIHLKGQVAENIGFKMEYDFAGGDADFRDVYLELRDLPFVGKARVGHFKEPYSLEELTSDNYITFMERGLNSAFTPSRNTGIGFGGDSHEGRMTWALGAFRETDGFGDGFGSDSAYNLTGRLSGLPYLSDDGERLLHVGFAISHQFRNHDMTAFSSKPESFLAPTFVSATLLSDDVTLYNPEFAFVCGPFSLQGEYTLAHVDVNNGPSSDFTGGYIQASYFITGEQRPYKKSSGAFSRVRPQQNFQRGSGLGAWEVATRYSMIDLDDGGVRGGQLDDFTFGINWYLNPFARVMFNYVFADLNGVGDTNIFQSRLQVDF